MIGIDTNVLVRYIVQDDPIQSEVAASFIEKKCSQDTPGFINYLVLCEAVWVFRRCYKVSNDRIVEIVRQILKTAQFKIQNIQIVWKALSEFERGNADFADCLISQINRSYGCRKTVTFDKDAAKTDGFSLLSAGKHARGGLVS